MEKNTNIFTWIAILSLFLYPISDILCIGVCLTALILSSCKKHCITRVMQPALMLSCIYFLRGLFCLILNIISTFASLNNNYYSSGLYSNITIFNKILNGICLCLVLLYAIMVSIFTLLNKDEPIFGSLSKSIISKN